MTIQVMGAAFGRTGTDSMREALGILGYGPCHHMREVNGNDEQRRLWRAFVAGAPVGWDQLLAGYRSCVDWPSSYYWRELMDVYPEAKVILTHRSPESWWASFERTILPSIERSTDPASVGLVLVRDRVFDGRPAERDHAIRRYEENVAAVRAAVPADRLLVHEIGAGWEPLCEHLGVPVPTVPYPKVNSTDEFRRALLGEPASGS